MLTARGVKVPLECRKRSGAFPADPAQDDSRLKEPGLDSVPLPSQELAVRLHRQDRGRGLPLPHAPPRPQTAPCQESWVLGELGAILCTHPAASAPNFGSSLASFPPGRPIRCSLGATDLEAPSPPHPVPSPNTPVKSSAPPQRPHSACHTSHCPPLEQGGAPGQPPSPRQPPPLGYPTDPRPPSTGSQIAAPARVPDRGWRCQQRQNPRSCSPIPGESSRGRGAAGPAGPRDPSFTP